MIAPALRIAHRPLHIIHERGRQRRRFIGALRVDADLDLGA
jgi:hypothetical protein